jgi:hypothetical protein
MHVCFFAKMRNFVDLDETFSRYFQCKIVVIFVYYLKQFHKNPKRTFSSQPYTWLHYPEEANFDRVGAFLLGNNLSKSKNILNSKRPLNIRLRKGLGEHKKATAFSCLLSKAVVECMDWRQLRGVRKVTNVFITVWDLSTRDILFPFNYAAILTKNISFSFGNLIVYRCL